MIYISCMDFRVTLLAPLILGALISSSADATDAVGVTEATANVIVFSTSSRERRRLSWAGRGIPDRNTVGGKH